MSLDNIIHQEPEENRPAWTTTFWPRLRDSLIEDPELFNHLRLECGICLNDMSVFPHDHTFSPDEGVTDEEKTRSHRARILPCGHMFGHKCIHTMIDDAMKGMGEREIPIMTCPSCREVFSPHRDCPHPHSGKFMPTTMEGVYKVPPTFKESGVLSHNCGNCMALEAISSVAALVPMFTPPLELTETETIIAQGNAGRYHWQTNLADDPNDYDEFVQEIPLGDELQRICDQISERLAQVAKRRWYSEDFDGRFEFKVMVKRDTRPRMDEDVEVVEFEVLEEGVENGD